MQAVWRHRRDHQVNCIGQQAISMQLCVQRTGPVQQANFIEIVAGSIEKAVGAQGALYLYHISLTRTVVHPSRFTAPPACGIRRKIRRAHGQNRFVMEGRPISGREPSGEAGGSTTNTSRKATGGLPDRQTPFVPHICVVHLKTIFECHEMQ